MKRSISLFKALPYFKVLDEYYGQCLPWLSIRLSEIEMNGEEDDEFIRLTEHVTLEALHDAFTAQNFETKRDDFDYVTFMWLVCNMYYGENYHKFMDSDNTDEFGVYAAFDVAKRVSAKLLPVLEDYKKSRDKLNAEKEQIKKDWEEETKEYWRKRRTELRKEQEAEWGKEEVEGENWKFVQEDIAEVVERHIKEEKEKALSEHEEWKKVVSAQEQLDRVKLNIGGSCVTINSAAFVLEALFRNHLFPHFLHDIDTVEKANALFVKKAGKKPEDNRITAVVYGTSRLFYEHGLIKTKTNVNLIPFIQTILRLMDLKNNKGMLPTPPQIEKMIQNLPKAETNPKFFSAALKPVDLSELKQKTWDEESELNWLYSPSRR